MKNASIFVFTLILSVLFNRIAAGEYEINQKDTAYYVTLERFYDGQGIVFSKDEDYAGYRNDGDERISLTMDEVTKSEIILDSLINTQFKDDPLKSAEIKAKLRKYNRQYFGFKTIKNEKVIVMFAFNFSTPKIDELF